MDDEEVKLLQDKIDFIFDHKIDDIPTSILPNVFENNYYFISYSHLDYRLVYSDLLLLEGSNLNIWYDRGIPAGKNWKTIANKYLKPFSCKGVLFYVSENSLKSDAVEDEIRYAVNTKKPFICINLPITSSYTHNGKDVRGQTFSSKELLDIMMENGEDISLKKYQTLTRLLKEEVIYLNIEMDLSQRIEKIKRSIPEQSLLRFYHGYDGDLVINGVKDNLVTKINIEKEIKLAIKNGEINDDIDGIVIGDCAFANCLNLEEIILPSGKYRITNVNQNAFHNCVSLKSFNNPNQLCTYGRYAFAHCVSLEKINFSTGKDFTIPEGIFFECTSLKRIDTNILFNGIKHIEEGAFFMCNKLEQLPIPTNLKKMDNLAFGNCASIKELYIPASLDNFNNFAFWPNVSFLKIEVDKNNNSYVVEEEILYSKDYKTLVRYPGRINKKQYAISNHVEIIEAGAFSNANKLNYVYIGKNVKEIRDYAFYASFNLKIVVIPKSVTYFGESIFEECTSLEKIIYEGTISQFKRIENYEIWDNNPNVVIECIDGLLNE